MRSVGRAGAAMALCLVALAGAGGAAAVATAPPGWIVSTKELEDGHRALHASRADGSGVRQITQGPNDYSANWSPDGRRIAFERSVAEDETAVWVVNADGSGARELDADPYAEHPRWSSDGRWIAYQVQTSFYIYDAHRANTTFELWLARPDGSGSRRLVRSEPLNENDNSRFYVQFGAWSWAPDGKRIAFTRPRRPIDDFWGVNVVDVRTGRIRLLGPGEDPSWSPDGRSLVVTVDAEDDLNGAGCGSIWVVASAGGTRQRLTRARRACDRFPRWSPDGRTTVFERNDVEGQSNRRFMAVAPDGADLQRVLPLRATAHRWSQGCSTLFEYTTPFDTGLVVEDTRGRPRFVPLEGDWRCGR